VTDALMSAAEIDAFNRTCPFNVWLGMRVVAANGAGIELEVPWRDEMIGSPDVRTMHGGVLAAIVEATAGLSLFAVLGRAGPAIDLRVDYHRPVVSGPLRGRGRVLRAGGTITSLESFVYDADERLVASGRAVFMVPRPASG
jgi:uncharacterized protein (TIGR00369 family)